MKQNWRAFEGWKFDLRVDFQIWSSNWWFKSWKPSRPIKGIGIDHLKQTAH